jgi:hypothetical protein
MFDSNSSFASFVEPLAYLDRITAILEKLYAIEGEKYTEEEARKMIDTFKMIGILALSETITDNFLLADPPSAPPE